MFDPTNPLIGKRIASKAVRLKTKASYATLPVDRFLIERLTHHVSRFSEPEPVSPAAQRRRQARGYVEPPDEGLIVTNRHGRPVLISDFHQKWRKAVKQAGLPERTRFHDLKHFYTSTLGGSGRHDPKTVQALSRHAKFSETWDTYAHPPLAVEEVTVTVFGTRSHTSTHRQAHYGMGQPLQLGHRTRLSRYLFGVGSSELDNMPKGSGMGMWLRQLR
ncbi:tyrosine-type recombinase/integrase [Streptomyces sp. NPDC001406]|uniref:tyrosine-type recombinase/integrase n=1 Tax=Streptomyces sp. NPDC001406 TaxID=3364572 RepID=UPI0036B17ABA